MPATRAYYYRTLRNESRHQRNSPLGYRSPHHKARVSEKSAEPLNLLAKIRGEADRPALRDRRVHELADGSEDGGDGFIVDGELFVEPDFELCKTARQFLVRSEHLTKLDEGAHHIDTHFDRARAVEDRRSHDRAMFGEGVRRVLAMLAAASL